MILNHVIIKRPLIVGIAFLLCFDFGCKAPDCPAYSEGQVVGRLDNPKKKSRKQRRKQRRRQEGIFGKKENPRRYKSPR